LAICQDERWKRVEWSKQSAGISLVPATEKPVEDDDEDEEDWNMTLTVRGVKKLAK
jgi:hypothetical protein